MAKFNAEVGLDLKVTLGKSWLKIYKTSKVKDLTVRVGENVIGLGVHNQLSPANSAENNLC